MRIRLQPWAEIIIVVCLAGVAAIALALAAPAHAAPIPQSPARAAASPPDASPAASPTTPASPGSASPRPSTPTPSTSPSARSSTPPPHPSPQSPPISGTDSSGCNSFDLACHAEHAINGWFKNLAKSAINPIFDLLGKTLLATPRLDRTPQAASLWSGTLVVANSLFVLAVLAGGLILMGHQSVQTSYTVKDIAPRLVIGVVLANISLLLIGHAIDFANGLSAALLGQGINPAQAAGQMKKILLHAINPADIEIFVILMVIGAVVLGTVLTLINVIRVMLTILLIAAAPLALACHALPQTEGLAKLWWRAFFGVLFIQVGQALVFITAMRVFFTTDSISWFGVRTPGDQIGLWIVECLLYILIRIPSWISRMVWQGGLQRSPLVRAARTLAAILLFRGLFGRGGGGRPRRTPPPPPSPPPAFLPPPQQWVQDELPLTWPPPRGGEQLTLPLDVPGHPAPRPQPPRPRWIQLRLPQPTDRRTWRQPTLFDIGYEQTRLPDPPPRRYVQPELPLNVPPRGSPQAGRSPRRLADAQALRDAEARARRRRPPT